MLSKAISKVQALANKNFDYIWRKERARIGSQWRAHRLHEDCFSIAKKENLNAAETNEFLMLVKDEMIARRKPYIKEESKSKSHQFNSSDCNLKLIARVLSERKQKYPCLLAASLDILPLELKWIYESNVAVSSSLNAALRRIKNTALRVISPQVGFFQSVSEHPLIKIASLVCELAQLEIESFLDDTSNDAERLLSGVSSNLNMELYILFLAEKTRLVYEGDAIISMLSREILFDINSHLWLCAEKTIAHKTWVNSDVKLAVEKWNLISKDIRFNNLERQCK